MHVGFSIPCLLIERAVFRCAGGPFIDELKNKEVIFWRKAATDSNTAELISLRGKEAL